MSNLSITGRLGVGVEVTVSTGKSYDKNGKTSQCYSIMPCVTAGTDAKVLGSATGSISNSSTSPGISTATQFCLDGGGAAAVGATGGVCQGSDGSTTGSAGIAVGAGAGASPKVCQSANYCKKP